MLDTAMRIIIGLGISLGLGCLITSMAHEYLHHQIRKRFAPDDGSETRTTDADASLFGSHLPLTGTIERAVFTLLVAYNVSGTAVAMIVWLGLKTAIGWDEQLKTPPGRLHTFHRLFTGLVSLLFALMGGLFIHTGMG